MPTWTNLQSPFKETSIAVSRDSTPATKDCKECNTLCNCKTRCNTLCNTLVRQGAILSIALILSQKKRLDRTLSRRRLMSHFFDRSQKFSLTPFNLICFLLLRMKRIMTCRRRVGELSPLPSTSTPSSTSSTSCRQPWQSWWWNEQLTMLRQASLWVRTSYVYHNHRENIICLS